LNTTTTYLFFILMMAIDNCFTYWNYVSLYFRWRACNGSVIVRNVFIIRLSKCKLDIIRYLLTFHFKEMCCTSGSLHSLKWTHTISLTQVTLVSGICTVYYHTLKELRGRVRSCLIDIIRRYITVRLLQTHFPIEGVRQS